MVGLFNKTIAGYHMHIQWGAMHIFHDFKLVEILVTSARVPNIRLPKSMYSVIVTERALFNEIDIRTHRYHYKNTESKIPFAFDDAIMKRTTQRPQIYTRIQAHSSWWGYSIKPSLAIICIFNEVQCIFFMILNSSKFLSHQHVCQIYDYQKVCIQL